MGASTSSETVLAEQREVETLASSTGALPILQNYFSKFSLPDTKIIPITSLQKCFHLTPTVSTSMFPKNFELLLDHLGSSMVDLFFVAEKGGCGWMEFVKGYLKSCGRMSTSMSLKNLIRVYATTTTKAGLPLNLHFEFEDDLKISGSLFPEDLRALLLMSWVMWLDYRCLNSSGERIRVVPDMYHLILSAVLWCNGVTSMFDVWEHEISGMEIDLPIEKIQMWALKTVPRLANCLTHFVCARFQCPLLKDGLDPSSSLSGDNIIISTKKSNDAHLLTSGKAWAVSLTLEIKDEILTSCLFPTNGDGIEDNLLYRSSVHGKGLNRFWSKIEGYCGSFLMMISATSRDSFDNGICRKWIIGTLIQQGFENRETFYGSSGTLYAFHPIFQAFPASGGREKNFVYSHLHPSSGTYERNPKAAGIAFGGRIGNERVFLAADFDKLTIRHHAVDKTYAPGSLIPNQGFLPVESLVSEVEMWGLGGKKGKQMQSQYKQREQIFIEQRRKIDLKTFSSWDDSPEKMMMDMVSNPYHAQREKR